MKEPVRRIGRVTTGGLTLVVTLLLLLQITTASPAIAAFIAISPSSGPAGSAPTISGSEFLPLIEVDLCWAGDGCSDLGTVTPSAAGTISAEVSIPSTADPGRYTVSACQTGLGCTQTAFDVLSDDTPATSAPTTAPNTTSPGSSTTIRTTTTVSTSPSTSSTTSTTDPVPTSAPSTTLAETTSTGPVEAFAASDGVTTTTEGVGLLAAEIDPAPNEPAPFKLDLSKVRARTQDSSAETAGDEVLAGDLGAPVLAGEASAEIPSLRFSADEGSSGFSLPSFGIWFGWLFLVVGSFVVIVTFDERQRRRD